MKDEHPYGKVDKIHEHVFHKEIWMTNTNMLSFTNSNVEISEPNGWHLFYDNSKYEEKNWYSHIVFGSINGYYVSWGQFGNLYKEFKQCSSPDNTTYRNLSKMKQFKNMYDHFSMI